MTDDLRTQLASSLKDQYEVLHELSGGGMARVFLAEELRLDRRVVIKVLPAEMSAGVSAERFEREIHLAAALQDPHIVPILTAGETAAGLPYYTMPYVEGDSLRERLETGPPSLEEAVSIMRDVATALEAAHRHHVIHRDIKPGNVLLTGRSAVVTDFGIAKALSASREGTAAATLTSAGVSIGTPAYMSPEQIAGDEIDARADLYSWGVLAYQLFAGKHPFEGRTSQQMLAAHVAVPPVPLGELNPRVPQPLQALVMKCLEKDRSDRPQSSTELLSEYGPSVLSPPPVSRSPLANGRVRMGAAIAVGLVVTGGIWARAESERAWARDVAPREIEALALSFAYDEGYAQAQRALSALPGDSALEVVAALVILDLSVSSDPPGAQVFRRPYVSTDAEWELLGITPLEGVSVPTGPSRIKLEMEGFRPYYTGAAPSISARLTPETAPSTTVEMVRVPRGIARPSGRITGLGHLLAQSVDEFDFGRFEVTNEQFKEFVDAGGYERRGLWATELARDGRTIPWEQAVRQFVDRTGRLGPATWALGTYPSGQGRFPVSGVSWYEADAYARFSGLQLPTIYHWMLAAWPHRGHLILPFSNVGGTSLVPVGELDGMSMSGAFDVAGNVREWTANAMGDQRIILGGSFEDPSYMFSNVNHLAAFNRSPGNGIRVADYAADPNQEILSGSVERQLRDFATERPAPEDVFAIYSGLYEYDDAPLAATVESRDSTPDWIRESVTFEGPDGDERVVAHLFLPPEGPSPYQTLVYFPGAEVLNANSLSGTSYHQYIQGFTRTGRAVLLPAYKGTLERRSGADVASWYPNSTTAYRDWVITMGRELKRSVDYLESRPELIDASKLAFFGNSWGGSLSGIMMAIEPRFKAGVLQCPGLTFVRPLPEVDPLHFLPRITIPVLMVNGQHDPIFPVETSQVPMYELLGTPEGRKRRVVVDAAHCPARTFFHAEALDWLDQHLGPVR